MILIGHGTIQSGCSVLAYDCQRYRENVQHASDTSAAQNQMMHTLLSLGTEGDVVQSFGGRTVH